MIMSPLPVQSMISRTLGFPSVVVCKPIAPGSTPVSKIPTITPLPSLYIYIERENIF